jgi:hypothetical protein
MAAKQAAEGATVAAGVWLAAEAVAAALEAAAPYLLGALIAL